MDPAASTDMAGMAGGLIHRTDPAPDLPPFAPRPVTLMGAPQVSGEDTDGDGGYNRMHVAVPLSRQVGGPDPTVRVWAAVENPDGTVVLAGMNEGPVVSENESLTVTLDGQTYHDGVDPAAGAAIGLTLLLVRADGSTAFLDRDRFPLNADPSRYGRAPLATLGRGLDGGYQETTPDADGNGLYDRLEITVPAKVTAPGAYRLTGDLVAAGGDLLARAEADADLNAGDGTIALAFAGDALRRGRVDGPWRLQNLALWKTGAARWPVADFVRDAHTTAPYPAAQFQPQHAVLDGTLQEQPVDTDGDGLYNELRLAVGLQVQSPGWYRVDAGLYDAGGNFIARVQSGTTYHEIGSGAATLVFPGPRLRIHPGPYALRFAQVYQGGLVVDELATVGATGPYQGEQFQPGDPDLYLAGTDVTVVRHDPAGPWILRARAHNLGGAPALAVPLRIAGDGETLLATTLERVAGEPVWVETTWPAGAGSHSLQVAVDPNRTVIDANYGNQSFVTTFTPQFPSAPRELQAAGRPDGVRLTWLQPEVVVNLAGGSLPLPGRGGDRVPAGAGGSRIAGGRRPGRRRPAAFP